MYDRDREKWRRDGRDSIDLILLEESLDGGLKTSRGLERGVSVDNVAMLVDEELLKVPLDASEAQQTGLLLLEVDVDGIGVVAVDIDLLEHREGDAVVELAEGRNVVGRTGLLAAKLVAGEADDGESLVLVLLVQLLETLVLGSEATLGGDVHDEHDLALQLLEGEGLSGLIERLESVECGDGFHCVI